MTRARGSALQVRVDAVLQRMHRLRQQNWPWRRARRALSADNRTNPGSPYVPPYLEPYVAPAVLNVDTYTGCRAYGNNKTSVANKGHRRS
ncbi:hypothetical protein [Cryobacterium sp. Y57]|uniref:hypothetical protein n=1 Tax=Cryobacterium sp. Y57 TaxID=2048287 RepID=UPI0011B0BC74|nr:hypothetical protein [Cryobacterium sp. Y57]